MTKYTGTRLSWNKSCIGNFCFKNSALVNSAIERLIFIFVLLNGKLDEMGVSDSEILTAFQRNMNEGGKLLFQRYYKPLVLFSGSMLDDCSFPEDIVQEVFYQFIKNNAYRQLTPEALSTYLFRSVKNACLNRIRDQKEFAQAELLKYDAIEEEATTVSLELIEAIRQAIERLPQKTRMVVMSIVVEGKKYKETAEELGVSVNTVKTLLSGGLKQLRQQFPNSLLLFFILEKNNF